MAAPSAETSPRKPRLGRLHLRDFNATAVGLIAVIFLTEAVIGILLLAINPQYPKSVLGAGVSVTGIAFSVYGAGKMPGQPFVGWLADRIEPRLVLVGGLLLTLPAMVLMERLHDVWTYVLAWALFGVTVAVVWPTSYAIVGHRFRPDRQGRLLALISMGQIAGTALGTGAGAVLIDHVSYGVAFLLALLLEAAALATALLVVPRDSKAASGHALPSMGAEAAGFASIRKLLTVSVVLLVVQIMLLSIAVAVMTPDLKPYSNDVLHVSYSTFVLLLVPPALAAAVLIIPSGYIADKFGRNLPIGAGIVLFGVGLLLLTLTHSPWLATVFATVTAAGYVLVLPAYSASLLDLSTAGNRGLLTGLTTSIQAIGLVIGPAVGGFLADGFGPLAPIRGSVVIVFVAALLSIVYIARTRGVYQQRLQSS